MNRSKRLLIAVLCLSNPVFGTQSSPKDISVIFAEGKITDHQYRSDYFGLTLLAPEARFTKGSFLSSEGKRARLIDAQADASNPQEKYGIAILADELSANPAIHSPEQYVRAVRHGLERQGEQTVEEQFTIEVSGHQFVGACTKATQRGSDHYRGIFTTFLKGYILSLDVSAITPERVKELTKSKVKFDKSTTD